MKEDEVMPTVEPAEGEAATPWRASIEAGFRALETAQAYADDGAYQSAARRAEQAAEYFRDGSAMRNAAITRATGDGQ